jgi:hypothetical protein
MNPIAQKTVVLRVPDAHIRVFHTGTRRALYIHDNGSKAIKPVVLLVTGYPDHGFEAVMGTTFSQMPGTRSWASLIADQGIAAVTYDCQDPLTDAASVLDYLKAHADELRIDPDRLGIWASSANVPTALAHLDHARCATLLYGYLRDVGDATEVEEAAARFGFANPAPDIAQLPPTLLIRAGRDKTPGLNVNLDQFVAHALSRNWPLSLVNCPDCEHSFDLTDEGEQSKSAIRDVLRFLSTHLEVANPMG